MNFTKDNPGENTRRGDQEQKETEWVEPPPVSFDDLMARIRHIVMTDRLRVRVVSMHVGVKLERQQIWKSSP